jgi:hypothetical protein
MSKHSHIFISVIALIFFIEGALFGLSALESYAAGFRGWAAFSFFITFVHFFIAVSLFKQKRYAPHIAIFFQAYIVTHFIISYRDTLYSPILFPSAIGVLSISAFITTGLFILRNNFTN